jgi:hypothetical protein
MFSPFEQRGFYLSALSHFKGPRYISNYEPEAILFDPKKLPEELVLDIEKYEVQSVRFTSCSRMRHVPPITQKSVGFGFNQRNLFLRHLGGHATNRKTEPGEMWSSLS